MLRKLLKYDLMASFRYLWMVYAAMILAAAMGGVSFLLQGEGTASLILLSSSILLLVLLGLAILVLTIVEIVFRFHTSLLKSEGYLMHTLPVHTWQLVASKLLSSVLVICASTVVCGIAAAIWTLCSNVLEDYSDFWNTLQAAVYYFRLGISGGTLALALASGLLGALELILSCYAALSLGQLADRHRILLAFVWFIVIRIVGNVLDNLLGVFWAYASFNTASEYVFAGSIQGLIVNAVLSIICFIITEETLSRRLNLE